MALIVFVCTGNMCRSPMAEVIARAEWAGPAGIEFASAGTAAYGGNAATLPTIEVMAELGLALDDHRSRSLSVATVGDGDIVYGMTRAHVRQIKRAVPEVADRVELMDPEGEDIEDPYGRSIEFYRETRDLVVAAVRSRQGEWRRLVSE